MWLLLQFMLLFLLDKNPVKFPFRLVSVWFITGKSLLVLFSHSVAFSFGGTSKGRTSSLLENIGGIGIDSFLSYWEIFLKTTELENLGGIEGVSSELFDSIVLFETGRSVVGELECKVVIKECPKITEKKKGIKLS